MQTSEKIVKKEEVERKAPLQKIQGQDVESHILSLGFHHQAFTERQQAILMQKIENADIDIHPVTGALYLTQVKYRRILSDAFGVGGWALLPYKKPLMSNNTIVRSYYLIIDGKLMVEATGAAEYIPNNRQMTYADALEAAKSDALKKACKDLCIATECWDKRWCKEFKAKYCEVYTDRGKKRWRRIEETIEEKKQDCQDYVEVEADKKEDSPLLDPLDDENPFESSTKDIGYDDKTQPESQPAKKLTSKQIKFLYAKARQAGRDPKELPAIVGKKKFSELDWTEIDPILAELEWDGGENDS